MKKNHHTAQQGFTLIEIIVSIAILGILIIAFSNAFTFGMSHLFYSGQKSSELMQLQSIVDDLNATPFFNTEDVSEKESIETYLSSETGLNYNLVLTTDELITYDPGESVNCFVSDEVIHADTSGYEVTFVKFSFNAKRHVELSTFVVKRGYEP